MARPIAENPAVFPLQSTPTRVLFVLLNASSRNVAIEFLILLFSVEKYQLITTLLFGMVVRRYSTGDNLKPRGSERRIVALVETGMWSNLVYLKN